MLPLRGKWLQARKSVFTQKAVYAVLNSFESARRVLEILSRLHFWFEQTLVKMDHGRWYQSMAVYKDLMIFPASLVMDLRYELHLRTGVNMNLTGNSKA